VSGRKAGSVCPENSPDDSVLWTDVSEICGSSHDCTVWSWLLDGQTSAKGQCLWIRMRAAIVTLSDAPSGALVITPLIIRGRISDGTFVFEASQAQRWAWRSFRLPRRHSLRSATPFVSLRRMLWHDCQALVDGDLCLLDNVLLRDARQDQWDC
jgi:hypothetical protein